MGFTKKQRREQKKQHHAPINYKKRRKKPDRAPGQQPARMVRPQQTMMLVKTSWVETEGDVQEQFQLIKLTAGTDAEQFSQEIFDRLRHQGKEGCTVELFDPDNVPPGTLPADTRIIPG